MAFGATSVLDDFTRADGDGLGSNWTEPMRSADSSSDFDIASNQVASGAADGTSSSAYWNPATFGPDVEAYITIATKPANVRVVDVFARVHEFTSTYPDGYAVRFLVQAGTDIIRIYRVDDGAYTQLGADITLEFAAGDGLGIECIGDQIAAYGRSSGVWSQIGVRTDATYNTAGNVGMLTNNGTTRLDSFGGGTVAAAASVKPKITQMNISTRRSYTW